ncbi:MAG: hypothetical protein WD425_09530 [Nitrospirales bacterium]
MGLDQCGEGHVLRSWQPWMHCVVGDGAGLIVQANDIGIGVGLQWPSGKDLYQAISPVQDLGNRNCKRYFLVIGNVSKRPGDIVAGI